VSSRAELLHQWPHTCIPGARAPVRDHMQGESRAGARLSVARSVKPPMRSRAGSQAFGTLEIRVCATRREALALISYYKIDDNYTTGN